jgi:hypothetical protein
MAKAFKVINIRQTIQRVVDILKVGENVFKITSDNNFILLPTCNE